MDAASERAAQLRREIAVAERATGGERRRQELLEQATSDGTLDRALAEQVYDLGLEESIEPAYALALIRSGLLVRELVPPERAQDTAQQDPPPWVAPEEPDSEAWKQERRLRASLRRLRAMVDREPDAARAVDAYLAEPDVGV
jgi:hypothetical protein